MNSTGLRPFYCPLSLVWTAHSIAIALLARQTRTVLALAPELSNPTFQ